MLTLFSTGMIFATYSITITTITIWKEEKIGKCVKIMTGESGWGPYGSSL